ncbi:MAG: efflux RND transporter permease subunit, partial [candidate division WOR-3 bacterium]|nr:efflux RND transporter permease subunit [candidate division WOR-3 bacterium]
MNLTDVSIKRPLSVSMVFLAIILFGFISVTNLPVDLFPNVTFPMMIVLTTYPGAGPEEIETQITEPLEQTLGTVNNIKKVTSTTSENISNILLEFEWGTDLDAASNDVRDRMGFILPYLPEDADYPLIFKFDISQQPVMMYNISGDIDPLELDQIADDIAERLQRVGGVAASYAMSGTMTEIQVILDPVKLRGTGITSEQVMQILQAQNVNYPLGNVESGRKVYIVRTIGEYANVAEIEKTVVGSSNGVPVLLSQVGEVREQASEITSLSRTNGAQSIWGIAQKRTDANSVNVGNALAKELENIKKDLPPGIKIDIMFNQADYITRSVNSTAQTLIMGAILAVIVLFLFLGSFRSTLYMAVAIPIAVFFALFFMYLFNMSLNIISLGGLTIAIGMVLDSAIVVFEAIFRHKEKGEEAVKAASTGAKEVGMAITASTLTTVAVFLPLLLVRGFASIFFQPLALTVTFALVSSLVVALTIIPMLSVRFGKVKRSKFGAKLNDFYTKIEEAYSRLIRWALNHRLLVVLGTLAVFVVSLFLIPFIGTELSPDVDQGEIIIEAEMPVGTNLWVTDSAVRQLEQIILEEVPETQILSTSIGSGEGGFSSLFSATSGPHAAQIYLELVYREQRNRSVKDIQRDLRPKMTGIPGLNVKYATEQFSMFGGGKPIAVKILGYDFARAKEFSDLLMDTLQSVKGLVDLETSIAEGKPELRLVIDRQKAANFGLTPYQIGQVLRSRVEGVVASQYRREGNEYNIKVMFDKEHHDDIKKISAMTITTPMGEVPIVNFIKDTIAVGPVKIEHEDNYRLVTVSGNIEGRDQGSVARDVQRILNTIPKPADFTIELSGGYEEQVNTFRDLFLVIILAIVLVYMIMVGQFESFREPFIIMFTIPLALIGVLWMLF